MVLKKEREDVMFYGRLEVLIRSSNKTFNEVERELGYPRNALKNYKNRAVPSGLRLLELANYFCVSPYYLLGMRTWRSEVETLGGLIG